MPPAAMTGILKLLTASTTLGSNVINPICPHSRRCKILQTLYFSIRNITVGKIETWSKVPVSLAESIGEFQESTAPIDSLCLDKVCAEVLYHEALTPDNVKSNPCWETLKLMRFMLNASSALLFLSPKFNINSRVSVFGCEVTVHR